MKKQSMHHIDTQATLASVRNFVRLFWSSDAESEREWVETDELTSDARVERHSDRAQRVVGDGRNLPRAARAVPETKKKYLTTS